MSVLVLLLLMLANSDGSGDCESEHNGDGGSTNVQGARPKKCKNKTPIAAPWGLLTSLDAARLSERVTYECHPGSSMPTVAGLSTKATFRMVQYAGI